MKRYDVAIIKAEQSENPAKDLCAALNAFAEQGWTVKTVCPNGINRWTVVVVKYPELAPVTR